MFKCVRVYPNGDQVSVVRKSVQEKDEWQEYNSLWRFGCALFVDGKCVYRGYLAEAECKKWERKLNPAQLEANKLSIR